MPHVMKSLRSAACLLGMLAAVPGCYDGELLVREARSSAVSTRVAEIDLGQFLTTLPRDRKDNSFTELEVHLFATVPRSRAAAVKRQLTLEDYRLRHDLLAALRGASSAELAEPSLALLRDRIERAVNAVLSEPAVKSIGFYAMTLRRR
jgi:hypothetical protein